jgi:CheY-like chemotaxis protein/anti-sigma regulatory factor (Ser/Thr protein kinase)
LLNDLLTISKIDEGKFSVGLEDVSLAHLFAYIDSLFRARADAKSLRFWLPDLSSQDVYVRSDQVRLTQIVSNLVSNAIKFTQVGEVLVEIKENDSTLELIITDTGNGIKDIDAALMAYHQEQTAKNMVVEGTGLGLEIVKKLCDALGHTLKITSTVGKGTTINIGLQKAIKRESDNPIDKVIEPSITEHCEPKTILIVDDNEINREIAKTMLQNLFPTVHSASNGEEAVNMVRTQKGYDVILMDLSMPIKNGYDAAREINTLVLNREARIIAVSADAFEEISHKCAENGIKQHVAKPFTKKSLLQAIRDPNEHLTF